MSSPSESLNDRLRKAMDDARKVLDKITKENKKCNVGFIPMATMFKLEERDKTKMGFDSSRRKMVCVSCGSRVDLDLYLAAPELQDKCFSCKTLAHNYWKNKPHVEIAHE